MTSSKAKKAEKKKDFQKAKLKVGKAKPKAANATDTSFRSKSIVLKNQHLNIEAPTDTDQITRHISLLRSTSDTQRKDSLNALAKAAPIRGLPTAALLPQCLPLMTDASTSTREQLLRLVKALPASSFAGFEEKIVLHLQNGLCSISSDIWSTTLDFVDWAIECLALSLVSCSGGWFNMLHCFLPLFGWDDSRRIQGSAGAGKWTGGGYTSEKLSKDKKLMSKALEVLGRLLALGLQTNSEEHEEQATVYFRSHIQPHLVARQSRAFDYLGLFGPPPDDESRRYDNVEDRREILQRRFLPALTKGLTGFKRHGGDVGRLAAGVQKVLQTVSTE